MMNRLKDYITLPCGVRYLCEGLEFSASASSTVLLQRLGMSSAQEVREYYQGQRQILRLVGGELLRKVKGRLHYVRDIKVTIDNLGDGAVLSDIELFELKGLAIIGSDICEILGDSELENIVELLDVSDVAKILDPEGSRTTSFYVYDAYHPELGGLRRTLMGITHQAQKAEIMARIALIEQRVRVQLCEKIREYAEALKKNLRELFELDIRIAQAEFMGREGLIVPIVTQSDSTKYVGLVNPEVRSVLQECGKEFQAVDIEFVRDTTMIVGANMGGKTVVLKSLALAQIMAQFGFGVAATSAEVALKEDVVLVVGDEQSTRSGLSSFAAEVLQVSGVIERGDRGEDILALIDEPARTTNPEEGTALVAALQKRMQGSGVSMVITTHYNIKNSVVRRYRVRGLVDGKMDFSLLLTLHSTVPQEALQIADSLGVDTKWIELAKKEL